MKLSRTRLVLGCRSDVGFDRVPVPDVQHCVDWCGTGIEGKRLTTMGKEQAGGFRSATRVTVCGGNIRTSRAQDKDEKQGECVNKSVVVALSAFGLALWPLAILLSSP